TCLLGRLLGPLLAVGLAITGALAVMCMAKVYGVHWRPVYWAVCWGRYWPLAWRSLAHWR
ncbi:hypothetical protein CQA77_30465, partial [Klebsiella pneumoniae]